MTQNTLSCLGFSGDSRALLVKQIVLEKQSFKSAIYCN